MTQREMSNRRVVMEWSELKGRQSE